MKKYNLSDVLSVTSGRMVSTRGMEGIYDILNYMTGESLFTHALPRAAEKCTPYLLEQFPILQNIEYEHVDETNWSKWLQNNVEEYGDEFNVMPLSEYTHLDPASELSYLLRSDEN